MKKWEKLISKRLDKSRKKAAPSDISLSVKRMLEQIIS